MSQSQLAIVVKQLGSIVKTKK